MRAALRHPLSAAMMMLAAGAPAAGAALADAGENGADYAPSGQAVPVKVAYHIADGNEQAARALGNIRNHLRAEPDTKIVVVATGNGIDFMLGGITDGQGNAFATTVAELAAHGVQFRVCNHALQGRSVATEGLLPQASVVPAGVAELARLQAREQFVYLRP